MRPTTIDVLHVYEVAGSIPGGVYFDDANTGDRTVRVCGHECVNRVEITEQLLTSWVSVRRLGCLGLCGYDRSSSLKEGTYARIPSRTQGGVEHVPVVILPDVV